MSATASSHVHVEKQPTKSLPNKLSWLAVVIFVVAMLPATIFVMYAIQQHNHAITSATIVANALTPNHHPSTKPSATSSIVLVPTLSVGIDMIGASVLFISVIGLCGVAKRSRTIMNIYFTILIAFILFQVGVAVIAYVNGAQWVDRSLDRSWQQAYETDPSLIRDLQLEFHCQGFSTITDRHILTPSRSEDLVKPCKEILAVRFGRRLNALGTLVLFMRLVQLSGVFLLCLLFHQIAQLDDQEDIADIAEKAQPSDAVITEKTGLMAAYDGIEENDEEGV
ncbi:Tetraspanin family-domain-containing protein [Jimgerdemannia flammicorona]|uniref:Tetraspanin family-domain-containing protein n=1 Tax=Jimgerdemannia flammicorona TaxID=994334 RepID=A0A433Q5B4_9FUNG|nr:Tetraspanin family-domain-containing protein [Jimgerdemannia flammicorona]